MITLRQLCAASALTFTLTFTVLAGDISTGIAPPPPPPSEPATYGQIETGVAGDMHTTITEEAADESVVGAALGLLQGALSLF